MTRLLLATAMILLATTAVTSAATSAEPQVTFREIERSVMCVTCGVPLEVAEAPAADAQRREIRRLIDEGLDRRQIEDRLIAIYGSEVLSVPRDRGLRITAILLPAALVAAAAGLLVLTALRWRRRRPDEPLAAAPLSADAERRVAADLEGYER